MLTPEREAEIRTKLETEGRTFGVKGTRDLLSEIDRLRAEVEEWKLEAERGKWPKEAAQEHHQRKAEIDRLRAEIAALREAGDGLEGMLRQTLYVPEGYKGLPPWWTEPSNVALARWREVRGQTEGKPPVDRLRPF